MTGTEFKVMSIVILPLLLAACSGGAEYPPVPVPSAPSPLGPEYLVAPVNATASSSIPGTTPSAVFDYDSTDTQWNSGGFAPQWITLDLGSPRAVTEVRLTVIQDPNGATFHTILGGLTLESVRPLAELTGTTSNGQTLVARRPDSASVSTLIQYLQIQTSASPSWVAWGKIEVLAAATNMPSYFGYYADAFSWLTPVTAEVIGHVNLSWVGSDLANVPTLLANLQYAQNQGIGVALAIPPEVFFEDDLTLKAQFQDNWNDFADQVRPYLDSIVFFYPIDEPYSQAKIIGTPAAEMKDRLQTVGSVIKATFSSIPIAFTFSAIDFDTENSAFADVQNPLPANYSWFGFDCYGSWESCGDPAYRSVHAIPWYVDRIKSKLGREQQIFLFADAFVRESSPVDRAQDEAEALLRLGRANKYYQLAMSDSSVVGLFGFLYQDDYVEESQRFLGVRHWPDLQRRYQEIGSSIIIGK